MSSSDYPVRVADIETRLSVLKKRQNRMMLLSVASGALFVASFMVLFIHQDVIYGLFGLTQQVEQLHLPHSIDVNVLDVGQQTDYLSNLLSWFGWLLLKVIGAFIGAFMWIGFLKKFQFFRIRFQSFVLKFVGWVVGFILLWGGLSYIQYDIKDDEANAYHELTHYDQSIQKSQIAQYLKASSVDPTVQDYLLAQTALLHKPSDQDVATAYMAKLMQAERTNPHFMEYGFKPEQLWSMQQQLYGQAHTPLAKSVEAEVIKANYWSDIFQNILFVVAGFAVFLSLIFYLLSNRLKGRTARIEHNVQS